LKDDSPLFDFHRPCILGTHPAETQHREPALAWAVGAEASGNQYGTETTSPSCHQVPGREEL